MMFQPWNFTREKQASTLSNKLTEKLNKYNILVAGNTLLLVEERHTKKKEKNKKTQPVTVTGTDKISN